MPLAVTVPQSKLIQRDEHYRDPIVAFERRRFSSDPLYVRFPHGVNVLGAFVLDAQAFDDASWAPKGRVSCDPPAGFGVAATHAVAPPGSTACDVPFRSVKTETVKQVLFPLGFTLNHTVEVAVKMDIAANGAVVGENVYEPSGSSVFDDAALKAATGSTYVVGRAFCRPVPGSYLFKVQFNPSA